MSRNLDPCNDSLLTARRRRVIKAARFDTPDRIPIRMNVKEACWNYYPHEALAELMGQHPLLFPLANPPAPGVKPTYPPWKQSGRDYRDPWGCLWRTTEDGITGVVIEHPLWDWAALDDYRFPDPSHTDGMALIDWNRIRNSIAVARAEGRLTSGGLRHGHTFLTLCYLRGYENTLFDMADEDRRLPRLIERIEAFNAGVVRNFLDAGVDVVEYPEDLGAQNGPLISPDHFRRYIRPSYVRLMEPAVSGNHLIHMHSDGDIRVLFDDILTCGVDVLDMQDMVNGIDWMARKAKGRVCIEADIDRQNVVRFGTPQEIEGHIKEIVRRLGDKRGGLMLKHGLYPGVPLENVAAIMDAMERYSQYYS